MCQLERDADGQVRTAHGADAAILVRKIMEAMGWPRLILVGCGPCSITALDAAKGVGDEGVAGLVLLGDLTAAANRAREVRRSELRIFEPCSNYCLYVRSS